MDSQEREEIIEAALQMQFPSIWEWQRTTPGESVGPSDIDVVDSFERYREQFKKAARQDLLSLTDAELSEMGAIHSIGLGETQWLRHLKSKACQKVRTAGWRANTLNN